MNWITILTFQNVHDAYIPKAKLETEGVPCFVKNENKMQAENPMARVELQVPSDELEKAKEILREGEFLIDEGGEMGPFWKFIQDKTDGIALLNKLPLEFRFIIIFMSIVLVAIVLIVMTTTDF